MFIGIVCRGFITRFSREAEWEERLEPVPVGEELVDGDAIPYYRRRQDGKFVENYAMYSTKEVPAYRVVDCLNEGP